MYSTLLFFHSLTRWFVLLFMVYSIFRAFKGYFSKAAFTKTDNAFRHWTATVAHIQLVVGVILYIKSPIIRFFFSNYSLASQQQEVSFFGMIHSVLMLLAIVILTIGSAKAKRESSDKRKFKTMLVWFSLALVILLLAIPWPFSPLASRPYFRPL